MTGRPLSTALLRRPPASTTTDRPGVQDVAVELAGDHHEPPGDDHAPTPPGSVSRLRCAPASRDAPGGQPPLVAVFRWTRVGASSAGEVSRPKAARSRRYSPTLARALSSGVDPTQPEDVSHAWSVRRSHIPVELRSGRVAMACCP